MSRTLQLLFPYLHAKVIGKAMINTTKTNNMKKLLVFGLLLFGAYAINAQTPNPGPQPTGDPTIYKGVTDLACAIEVQFGSYSAGIDGKAYDKVIALIDANKLKYTSKNIGREGETRLCLPLTELSKKKKNKFIAKLKKIAKEGQLVSISIR